LREGFERGSERRAGLKGELALLEGVFPEGWRRWKERKRAFEGRKGNLNLVVY
jgi:hypothetical protein